MRIRTGARREPERGSTWCRRARSARSGYRAALDACVRIRHERTNPAPAAERGRQQEGPVV